MLIMAYVSPEQKEFNKEVQKYRLNFKERIKILGRMVTTLKEQLMELYVLNLWSNEKHTFIVETLVKRNIDYFNKSRR